MLFENRIVLNADDITNLLKISGKDVPDDAVVASATEEGEPDEDQFTVDDQTPVVVFWQEEVDLADKAEKAVKKGKAKE